MVGIGGGSCAADDAAQSGNKTPVCRRPMTLGKRYDFCV
jgi:hypothetical protein